MIRIGVDFGGTKIEAAALDADGRFLARERRSNPGSYTQALETVRAVVEAVEAQAGGTGTVGVGMPGSISPRSGLIRNANSVWLNGQAFGDELQKVLERPVRLANDANCLALSEAVDGAAVGAHVVFGVIIGTGCGGGIVVDGRLLHGANGIGGEWGHAPLPWPSEDELGIPRCWCGRRGCLETWVSGTGFEADHRRRSGRNWTAKQIVEAARSGDSEAQGAFDAYVNRLGRGLAVVADVLDPDVIVFGGGVSNVPELYGRVGDVMSKWMFSDVCETRLVQAKHGDSSGVRGAAWLWPLEP